MYFAKHINYVTISASFSNLLILCKNAIFISLLDIKNAKKRECSNLHSLFYIWWRWRSLNINLKILIYIEFFQSVCNGYTNRYTKNQLLGICNILFFSD